MKQKITLIAMFVSIATYCSGQKKLIWTHSSPGKIEIANTNGENRFELISGDEIVQPYGIFIDEVESKIYWTDRVLKTINKANYDGSEMEELISFSKRPNGVSGISGDDWIYFGNESGQIQRYNKQNEEVELIYNPNLGIGYSVGVRINNEIEKIYWTDSAMNTIMRSNLDGTEVETIVDFGFDVVLGDLAFDYLEDKIYWVEAFNKKIQRSDFDGNNIEDIVTQNLDNPVGIVLEEGQNNMYWVERGTPKRIMTSGLDGGMKEQLISGNLNFPYFIAILDESATFTTESQKFLSISISPNPVEKELFVITEEQDLRYEILDLNGRVLNKLRELENRRIDVSNLPFGFYFLHIISKGNQKKTIKFEKK